MNIDSQTISEILASIVEFSVERGLGLSERQVNEMLIPVLAGTEYLDSAYTNWTEDLALNKPNGIDIDIAVTEKAPDYVLLSSWKLDTAPATSNLRSDVERRQRFGFALVGEGDEAERTVKNFAWREILAFKKLGAEYRVRKRERAG